MRVRELLKKEIQMILRNRIVLISLIAVLFIPVIYCGMFLWAFWDPYAHLDELPVAVVNNDKGAVFEGERLKIGDELVKNLKEKKAFDWHFVSEEDAEKGLKKQKYYMAVFIPEDFSENAASVLDEKPKRMKIIYKPNESYNFLSAQIGDRAVEQLKEEISSAVTETYAETVFEKISETAEGLEQASAGAKQLKDGIAEAKKGAAALGEGLNAAKEGSGQLKEGARSAKEGARALKDNLKLLAEKSLAFENGLQSASGGANALNAGIRKLDDGFAKMQEGNAQLLAGAKQAENGAGQLAKKLRQSLAGMKQMQEGMPQLVKVQKGAESLSDSLGQWAAGAEQVSGQVDQGFGQILGQLEALIGQTDDPKEKATLEAIKGQLELFYKGNAEQPGIKKAMARLTEKAGKIRDNAGQLSQGAAAIHELSKGMNKLVDGQEKLAAGAESLASGQAKIVNGLAAFGEKLQEGKAGVDRLLAGSDQLSDGVGQLYGGSRQFADGTGKLAAGAGELSGGIDRLASGTNELSGAMDQLADGSGQLTGGMEKLADGSGELAGKLKAGAEKAKEAKTGKDTYEMFADPVKKDDDVLHHVPNYGTGFAPYFLSLGLYVGALILSIVFSLREPAGEPKSGFSWFIEKFSVLAAIAVLQSLLLDAVMLWGLDLQVQSVPNFILFTVITSITFVSLVQFLVTPLANVGRFLAVLLLIFQLTSSAGTFPLELIPEALQRLNPWLPMTYSVFGFKAAISSGDFSFMWQNAGILGLFTAAFAGGTILFFHREHKRKYGHMRSDAMEAPRA
ncbi:YhgE/Pip domain-containing protein [Caldibacillus debilis]|mgnify:CR=1 FL=1|uniref:YhgE/Pip domain-containing protein n=1 Tax=Caldibacillus debilis TaxID=301148 RepID=UPI000B57CBF1|nr:YhgE/Pip domain-containing protein [Caldibacillus debilis]OUM91234.1 MAG: hypothetical protein BAA03_07540 [Caldibacillus debilis]